MSDALKLTSASNSRYQLVGSQPRPPGADLAGLHARLLRCVPCVQVRTLASGSFGVVTLAYDTVKNCEVAVKLIERGDKVLQPLLHLCRAACVNLFHKSSLIQPIHTSRFGSAGHT